MKILKLTALFSLYAAFGWLSVGCGHTQVPPTSFKVSLTWTTPPASGSWSGCTTASPCTFVASRITVASGATSCPTVNTTTPNYTPLNTTSPAIGTSFADAGASGLTVCYVVQTEQGSAVSNPSNVAGPFVVPASPLAPSISGATATAKAELLPMGSSNAPVLTAKLTPIR